MFDDETLQQILRQSFIAVTALTAYAVYVAQILPMVGR